MGFSFSWGKASTHHSHGRISQKSFSLSFPLTVSFVILISVFDEAHRDGCLRNRHLDKGSQGQTKSKQKDQNYLHRQFLGEHIHHIGRRRFVRPLNIKSFNLEKETEQTKRQNT